MGAIDYSVERTAQRQFLKEDAIFWTLEGDLLAELSKQRLAVYSRAEVYDEVTECYNRLGKYLAPWFEWSSGGPETTLKESRDLTKQWERIFGNLNDEETQKRIQNTVDMIRRRGKYAA